MAREIADAVTRSARVRQALQRRGLDNGHTVVDSPQSRNISWVYPHSGDEGYWDDVVTALADAFGAENLTTTSSGIITVSHDGWAV